jgi:5-hydroxyisourate hydrolase
MPGFLTTHVLDTARGCPAEGLKIALYRVSGIPRDKIAEVETNADGRTDTPILPEAAFETGTYELIFFAGDYLRATGSGRGGAAVSRPGADPLRHGRG